MTKRFRKKRSSANPRIRVFIVVLSMTLATLFIIAGVIVNYRVPTRSNNKGLGIPANVQAFWPPVFSQTIFGNVVPGFSNAKTDTAQNPSGILLANTTFFSRLLSALTDINSNNLWSLLSTQIPVLHPNGYLLHTDNPTDVNKYTNPPTDPGTQAKQPGNGQAAPPSATDPHTQLPGGGKQSLPQIYIYQTHNRESFLPELEKGLQPNQAYDPNVNITLVGERLTEDLNTRGLTTIQTTNDYWKYGDYPYSRKTVEKELQKYPQLSMIFDIHRDSGPRDKTTTVIDGKTVSRIFFIIGGANPNYQENLKFASLLNKKMETLYPGKDGQPGLSEGIWVKQKNPSYDTTYNQDLNPNMVLIEIGGPYNTLDEENRAADLLANVIQSVWQDGHKQ
ncbi:stage II sporulation protein P [Fodinisporobacter ferrooxydans]|uniref:Stage II sporulation protein P n=1 Tax=Fodinisporobacter ferrooxydans TaxID=2901836 RepID=A0ABY4CNE1_9BACL|nr:stage II sporulation protein P [Alicyclobacillaceae bacterium MYW30-H2]